MLTPGNGGLFMKFLAIIASDVGVFFKIELIFSILALISGFMKGWLSVGVGSLSDSEGCSQWLLSDSGV